MRNSLRQRRLAAGWSQSQLADRLGVTRLTIISIEKERFDPSLPLAFRIGKLFECPIEDVFVPDVTELE